MGALPDGIIVVGVGGLASNDMSRPNIAGSASWNHLASVKGSEDEIELTNIGMREVLCQPSLTRHADD